MNCRSRGAACLVAAVAAAQDLPSILETVEARVVNAPNRGV